MLHRILEITSGYLERRETKRSEGDEALLSWREDQGHVALWF